MLPIAAAPPDLMTLAGAALVMFFVTIGPLEIAPVFAPLTARADAAKRRHIALRATLVGGATLLVFALGGQWLLRALGITFPAFHIAGGILLLLLAVDLLLAHKLGLADLTPSEQREAGREADVSVFPLAIPLIAGPGTMTAILLLMDRAAGSLAAQGVVIGAMLVVLAGTYISMRLAGAIARALGETGVNVLSRISGLLLAALAVQFVLDGVRASGVLGGH
jgi:multiple antibiotic resistance protein